MAPRVSAPAGVVSHYLHMSPGPGLGRIAALVGLSCSGKQLSDADRTALEALGHQLAMHTVAARPMCALLCMVPKDGHGLRLQQQHSLDLIRTAGSWSAVRSHSTILTVWKG